MRRLGVYVRLGERIDLAVNELIQRLGRRLLDDLHPGVTDVQPSYTTLYVEYDAQRTERAAIDAWLAGHLAEARAQAAGTSAAASCASRCATTARTSPPSARRPGSRATS